MAKKIKIGNKLQTSLMIITCLVMFIGAVIVVYCFFNYSDWVEYFKTIVLIQAGWLLLFIFLNKVIKFTTKADL